jgi:hypothetical protein
VKIDQDASEPGWRLALFWLDLQRSLFGFLEEESGPLLPSHQQVAMVLEVVRVEERVAQFCLPFGRPAHSRKQIARAFVAKAVLNIPTTKDLVERLLVDSRLRRICGFTGRVPSESTFSRALEEFSNSGVLDQTLEASVRRHLGQDIIHHVSHDSTALPARERALRKAKAKPKPDRKKGRRRGKDDPLPPKVQELQELRSWQESISACPSACDFGVKIGSMGFPSYWRGYKGHVSVGDGGVPLMFFTTSASMSDALGAIPLMKAVAERTGQVFYNLFDRGYPGEPILRTAQALDQVAIVAPKKNRKDQPAPQMTPDRAKRFENRTAVERFNSDLKENHGGSFIFVRGAAKVHAHLMFGVLTIFALRILRI